MPIYTVQCYVSTISKRSLVQRFSGATEIATKEEITLGEIENDQQLIADLIQHFQDNPKLKNKVVFMVEITGLKAPTKKILAGLK